jgi:branched-chain amino acid transport system substrate-binding protein
MSSRWFIWSRVWWVGLVAVASLVAAGCGSTSPPQLVLGEVGPAAGPLAVLGRPQEIGARLAVGDINSGGGVLGQPVKYVTLTGSSSGADAGQNLLKDGVNAVVGAPGSEIGSFDRRLSRSGIAQCIPANYVPYASYAPRGLRAITTAPPGSTAVGAIGDQIVAMAAHNVVIATRNDAADESMAHQLVVRVFHDAVATTVVPYDPTAGSFDGVAHQVLRSDPQVVVELSYGEGPALTHSLLKAGAKPSQLIGGPGLFTPQLAQQVGLGPTALDGMHVVGPGGDATFDRNVGLIAGYGLIPAAQAYDCAVIIALAAQQAHSTNPAQFSSHLAEVTTGANRCSTFPLCRNLVQQGKGIAYVGKAGPLRLVDREPTSAREVVAVFTPGALSQVGENDYPVLSSP